MPRSAAAKGASVGDKAVCCVFDGASIRPFSEKTVCSTMIGREYIVIRAEFKHENERGFDFDFPANVEFGILPTSG